MQGIRIGMMNIAGMARCLSVLISIKSKVDSIFATGTSNSICSSFPSPMGYLPMSWLLSELHAWAVSI